MKLSLLKIFVLCLLFTANAYACSNDSPEEEDSSAGMQASKRVALHEHTKELPSRGYQWSSFVVKKSKQLQASKRQNTLDAEATSLQ